MASTLNTKPGREAATRFVAANQARFDSATVAPGAAKRRMEALEASLAAARSEAAQMREALSGFQSSTTWRLTRPLRWLVEAVKGSHPAPPAPELPEPASPPAPLSYEEWIRTEEPDRMAALWRAEPGHQPISPPRLGVVLLNGADAPSDSAGGQPGGCTLVVMHPGEAVAALVSRALGQCDADLWCFLDAGERLAPNAVPLASHVLAQYPHTDLLFADEDWLDAGGHRVRPFFKPGWDGELQRGRDLVGPFAFFRTALVRQATLSAGPAWRYDLANQVAAATQPDRIRHVPAVLCHRTARPPDYADQVREAAAAQLRREAVTARSCPVPGLPDCSRVLYEVPRPEPLVSIIVPTRDRADLLRVCADGILHATDYPNLELLIVDNGTAAPDALALLDELAADARVRVLRRPGPFNWSALNNAAAVEARGAVLVLLNNDIAVLQPDWLAVLVSHAIQPGVGAVGAKLLYPDGRVQHAGLTTDMFGIPLHLFRYAPDESAGAFGMLALARQVWAVTGACLAIRRDVFHAVGGLNEALPVAYNDVDLCLRLTAHGYRLVWTPWSRLEHRELASRPPDHAPERRDKVEEERNRLLRDWGALALVDPFLNPNLHLVEEQPCLRQAAGGAPAAPHEAAC